jgi:AcrR family transcriptional regulator
MSATGREGSSGPALRRTNREAGARARLLDGMTQAVARHGYVDATVAHALENARVGRATFYEHFEGKEDCLFAAFREYALLAAAKLGEALRLAVAAPREDAERDGLRVLLSSLLEEVERQPAAARLLLIESLAAGPLVRGERERLIAEGERAIERFLDDGARAGSRSPDLPTKALVGGVLGVISSRLLRGGDVDGLAAELSDDLLAWVQSYAVPAGHPRHSSAGWAELGRGMALELSPPADVGGEGEDDGPRRLPRGRQQLPAELAGSAHRERILQATAQLARTKGYAAMTVTDIVAAARISRNAFYAHFPSKGEAYGAAQTMTLQTVLAAAASAFATGETWPERVWAGVAEATRVSAIEVTDLAWMEFVETYAAGPAALERRHGSQLAFSLFLEDGYRQRPEAASLPRLCSEAIGSALAELGFHHIASGCNADLRELVPQSVYIVLAPFIGPVAAGDFVAAQAGKAAEKPRPRRGARNSARS